MVETFANHRKKGLLLSQSGILDKNQKRLDFVRYLHFLCFVSCVFVAIEELKEFVQRVPRPILKIVILTRICVGDIVTKKIDK